MKYTLDRGMKKIILCIGGSATTDGGVGILEALGIRFLNADNNPLKNLPVSLIDLSSIDISKLDNRISNCELIILCDVENTMLGENGAVKIFGPQKGANKEDAEKLEAALTKFRNVTFQQTGKDMASLKHGGAAGGVAAGLSVFMNAELVNGIEYFLGVTKFDEALQKAAIVITGEGSIDEQTLNGKGPYGVAKRAKEKNIPVIGLAGKISADENIELKKYFDVLLAINNDPDVKIAMQHTKENLVRAAKAIGDLLALNSPV
jgi:glycerate kinase